MKDLIWTIIIIWFLFKLVQFFQSFLKPAAQSGVKAESGRQAPKNKDQKAEALGKYLDNEGEYVEFKEIK
jgi:hypothetical protein